MSWMPDGDGTVDERVETEAPATIVQTQPESATDGATGSAAEADDAMDREDGGAVDGAEEVAPVFDLDPVVAGSEDVARAALLEITPADTIGPLVATLAQGEHVVSLQFVALMRGYPGWLWTASLSRIDETEDVNVLEVELLPGDGAVLSPDWVPWSVRLADYRAAQEAAGEEFDGDDSDDEFDDQVELDEDDSDDDEDRSEDDSEDDSDDDDSDEDDSDEDDSDEDDDSDDDDESDDDDSDEDDDTDDDSDR